jgi:hypothetical protein
LTPASIIPVFGSQRPYADLNFAGGSFGLDGRSVSNLTALSGFTFTRASLAMGYDATGKLVYGPNNRCLQSQTFDNASWAKDRASVTANITAAPDGTLTADKLIEDATASNSHRAVATLVTTRAPYVFSVYAKADTRSWIYLRADRHPSTTPFAWFDLANGTVGNVNAGFTASMVSAGGGWYRCAVQLDDGFAGNNSFIVGLATGNSVSNYTGDGTSGVYLWGAQIEAVTYQTTPSTYYPTTTAAYYGPRLVYDPVTLASQGILVEEARTNSWLQSGDFATTWTLTGATVTTNGVVSPDGTSNMDTLVEDSGSSTHRAAQTITTTAAAWTMSCYARARNRSWLYFRIADSGAVNRTAFFNVSTGVVGTLGTGFTASIQSVGNGIYRCIATMATAYAGAGTTVIGASDNGSNEVYTGNGLAALDIWGAQLELGTGASSPIPTTTAAVTRAADVALLAASGATYPMTVVATFTRAFDNGASDFVYQVDGGNSADRVTGTVNGSDLAASSMTTGGVGQGISTSAATVAVGALTKIATRFDTSAVQLALNGTLATPSSAVTLPSAPTTVRIGLNDTASNPGNLMLARLQLYNRALPDAQLQSLTT